MDNKPLYRSMAVANWFIDHVRNISPLKLQKLIYYAHGWNLALRDQPLIDEYIEAWEYGPVVPNVYHEFKHYGNQPITKHGTVIEMSPEGKIRIFEPLIPPEDIGTGKLLDKIVEVFGHYSALQLSSDTHRPGTPWRIIRDANPNRKNVDIPDELIQKHFKNIASQSRTDATRS
jgi:uncharacterized phage-associated protein